MIEYVYFIGNEESVKIGYSIKPERRLGDIQVGNPKPLELLAKVSCESGLNTEKDLHEIFKEFRAEGEWFNRNPKLDFVIRFIQTYEAETAVEVFKKAFWAYSHLPYQRNDLYFYETYIHSEASYLCHGDLARSNRSINASQLRAAIAYYRNWLISLGTLNYKRFKEETPLLGTKNSEPWKVVTELGEVHYCPNFFFSNEFHEIRKPLPAIKLIEPSHKQLEMFAMEPNKRLSHSPPNVAKFKV